MATLKRRVGFTLLELTVAAGLLGMVFLATIPLLGHVRETREDAQQRFIALQEAANVMEALNSGENGPTPAAVETMSASAEARDLLPDVTVAVTTGEQTDEVGHVRVTVAVSWLNDAGRRGAPVTLDAWLPARKEQP